MVPIANSADYHQVTGTFFITLTAIFLPIETIYHGKTNHYYAKFNFPEKFNITHNVNHWSNGEKAIDLYLTFKKGELGLHSKEEWILIADVFKEQWTNKVKHLLKKNHGKRVPAPHNIFLNQFFYQFFRTSLLKS